MYYMGDLIRSRSNEILFAVDTDLKNAIVFVPHNWDKGRVFLNPIISNEICVANVCSIAIKLKQIDRFDRDRTNLVW